MKRFVLPPTVARDRGGRIDGRGFHYLHRVRRLGVGASFPATDGDGGRYTVMITALHHDGCTVQVVEEVAECEDNDDGRMPDVEVYQSLTKAGPFARIIRQCTEMGVRRLCPVESEYTVPRPDRSGGGSGKRERWERIVEEAMRQCGATHRMDIAPLRRLPDVVRETPASCVLRVVFHPVAPGSPPHELLSKGADAASLQIFIGAEGGFSAAEARLMADAGFLFAHLGHTVLRADTAAVYAVAWMRGLWGGLSNDDRNG